MAKNIDFNNLGFGYIEADFRYVSIFKDGAWQKGELVRGGNFEINEYACVLHYAQTCFEGMKAFRQKNGDVVLFRPDMNATRLQDSCKRLLMPPVSVEQFMEGVTESIKANPDLIPPYDSGASLYIRPVVFGMSPTIGVVPSVNCMFRVIVNPVGSYFKNDMRLMVTNYDRAAPMGTGDVKLGLNYAMSLWPEHLAKEAGFDGCLYLDPKTHTTVEETHGANVLFVTKDGKLVTPNSNTILPSITRNSILHIAKEYLKIPVEERTVLASEIKHFAECGVCGTAAVISTVASITHDDKEHKFKHDTLLKIKEVYNQIIRGEIEAPEGWLVRVK